MSTSQTNVCVIGTLDVCIDSILESRHMPNQDKGIPPESMRKGTAMQLEGAVIKEQGQTFAVVAVKRHVTDNQREANDAIRSFSRCFPGMPIVLMSQDSRGTPTYFGRRDIANFLSRISMNRIPWKRYTFN
jgi:hypothetical protein